jgi:hypothetical protein
VVNQGWIASEVACKNKSSNLGISTYPLLRAAEEISSHNRVAATELLYYIMLIPGPVGKEAHKTANWIPLHCFLFQHEKDLLSKIQNNFEFHTGAKP